jgi:uncharacterized membrane protein YbhN (UPF0104 family)
MTVPPDGLGLRGPRVWKLAFETLVFGLALATLLGSLARADWRGAITLIAGLHPSVVLTLLPFAVAMAVDTWAQRLLLSALGARPRYWPLYRARLSAEALSVSLPAGAVFADAVSPVLLARGCGVPYEASVVANVAKRWLTLRAQSGYLALSAGLGYATLSGVSSAFGSGTLAVWLVCGSALLQLVASIAIGMALTRSRWAQSLAGLLARLPSGRVRAWLAIRQSRFAATDAHAARLRGSSATLWVATALFLGGWLLESVEVLVILRVLGAPLGFQEVIAFEAGLSFVRHLAFFLPAGLGLQDLGYLAFLNKLGLPQASAVGAAFVMLKRAKEVVWISAGYLLLFVQRWLPNAPSHGAAMP